MSSYLYCDVDFGFGVFILSKTGKQINISYTKRIIANSTLLSQFFTTDSKLALGYSSKMKYPIKMKYHN